MLTALENPDDFSGKVFWYVSVNLSCFMLTAHFTSNWFHQQSNGECHLLIWHVSISEKRIFLLKIDFCAIFFRWATKAHSGKFQTMLSKFLYNKQKNQKILRRLSIFIGFSHLDLNASMRPSTSVKNNHVPKRWRNWNSAWVSNRLMISEWKPANVETKWKI